MRVPPTLLVIAALTAAAAATDTASANPYPYTYQGVIGSVDPAYCVGAEGGSTRMQTGSCPPSTPLPLSPAAAGPKGAVEWGAPVPGSVIERISYDALRWAAPSSFGARFYANSNLVTEHGDAIWPQSPAGGANFSVPLPAGTTHARFELAQSQTVNQHARAWWIGNPTIWVRDVAAPTVSASVAPAGWTNANNVALNWTVADNFGSSGVGVHTVTVDGNVAWSGAPGACPSCAITLPTGSDGVHVVRVDVAGNGTGGGSATTRMHVDKTPPAAQIRLEQKPSGRYRVVVNTADATSGTTNWRVFLPGGQLLADQSTGTAPLEDVNLSGWAGQTIQMRVQSQDAAGNTASALSAPVQISPRPVPTPDVAARLSVDPVLTRQVVRDLRRRKADVTVDLNGAQTILRPTRGVKPTDGQTTDTVSTRIGTRAVIRGQVLRNGAGIPRAAVLVNDNKGRVHAVAVTNKAGQFVVRPRLNNIGLWQITVLGAPQHIQTGLWADLTPNVTYRVARRRGGGVIATGRLLPARRGKLVELQWRDPKASWRPLARARVNANGRFRLTYTRTPNVRNLRLRIWVPNENKWAFPDIATSQRTLRVR